LHTFATQALDRRIVLVRFAVGSRHFKDFFDTTASIETVVIAGKLPAWPGSI
jgi:hypothetical protein